jgi:hypothetical protein
MLVTLAELQQAFDIIVVQTWPVSHMSRFDAERFARRVIVCIQQGCPEELVQRFSEGGPARRAFAL